MSNKDQFNDTMSDISTRLQDVIEKGNKRRFIVRKENGDTLINVTLTTAIVVVVLALIFLNNVAVLLGIAAVGFAIYTRAKVEIAREIDENTNVVTVEKRKVDDSDVDAA